MCLTALFAGIDELILPNPESICGDADEVQFGDETIYCSDEYSTFSESLSDMEVVEQHFDSPSNTIVNGKNFDGTWMPTRNLLSWI